MRQWPASAFEQQQQPPSLISEKGWICWHALTTAEKIVCLNIVCIPLWWVSGLYQYWPGILCAGIVYHEMSHYGKVRLRSPNFMVTALLCFCTYQCVGLLLFSVATKLVSITAMNRTAMFWFPPALILWYTQSHRIRVRLEVMAWACSVLALEMLVFWIVGQGILGGGAYDPPRSLFSIVSGNASGSYSSGKGLTNYLIPYLTEDSAIFGSARWNYFFVIPELAAVVSAFIALIALDIPHRKWSMGLFSVAAFLVLMAGTRSVWLGLPIIMVLRYSFVWGRTRGYLLPLAVIAVSSFVLLATPAVTSTLLDFYSQASETVSSYRGLSTDIRGEIYSVTLERIPNRLFFGHWIRGESLLPGSALAKVGSHSFIISSLLYRLGLVGTLLFVSFWVGLAIELIRSRFHRPLFGLCIMLLYTLLCVPMEFGGIPALMVILVTTMVYLNPAAERQHPHLSSRLHRSPARPATRPAALSGLSRNGPSHSGPSSGPLGRPQQPHPPSRSGHRRHPPNRSRTY
ncbi:MAG: O-antigen ligase family protein [Cyanobacteria bacterium J06597_16]